MDDALQLVLYNMNDSHSVNVSVGVYATICKYYDTEEKVWDTKGCVSSDLSCPDFTLCHCNHMTLYGASMLPSPAQMNFQPLV